MSPDRRADHPETSEIVQAILRAIEPGPLVAASLPLALAHRRFRLLAVGKAARPMTAGLSHLAQPPASALRIDQHLDPDPDPDPDTQSLRADHPIPTEANIAAAEAARRFVAESDPSEPLLVLLSGGASAMLALPRPGLDLAHLAAITDALLRAGAPITELNAVRKHCEVLKGGGLAAACPARSITTLILSDVLGDPLDAIGSGPTAPDPTTFADALRVLESRGLLDAVPPVTALLRSGAAGGEPETVKPDHPIWSRVQNVIVGNNRLAIDAACASAESLGHRIAERREGVEGEAAERGREIARAAASLARTPAGRAAIVWGGECTVTVGSAAGRGGRNQELALAAAIELDGVPGVRVVALATDGRDGPTDVAGAQIDGTTAARLRAAGIDPREALRLHDSHGALEATGALIRTGPTGTNVNDVTLALVG